MNAPSPGGGTRTWILLRHAKSDYPGGTRDIDRPLADRGEREAAAAGEWLAAHQPPVDHVVCSSAVRTRQTLAATGVDAPVDYRDEIYDASSGEILDVIRKVGDDVDTLLVVGHAPGIPSLAHELAGPDSDDEAMEAMSARFPTSAMAVLSYRGDWSDLDDGGAALTAYEIARVDHFHS